MAVYLIYLLAIFYFYGLDALSGDDLWPVTVWITSLAAILLWYVLGEWVIRPNATAAKWLATWWLIFVGLGIFVAVACFMETFGQTQSTDAYPWLHVVGCMGAFYVCSVLFSPLFARYTIWPARLIYK
jgi:vacuolar-type H+-ATPase subunit I/STV1